MFLPFSLCVVRLVLLLHLSHLPLVSRSFYSRYHYATLQRACLRHAALQRACLRHVALQRTCLRNVALQRACLRHVMLQRACLVHVMVACLWWM